MAQGWDPLRGDTSDWEDRAFFLSLIGSVGEPVLDVGCGTGRLLVDYLAQGVDIDGVEISPDMVSILRDKASAAGLDVHGRVHLAAMETMALARRYQLVIVPSGSYHLLVDPTHATSAMHRFFEHLKPGGTLAVTWLDIAGDHPDGADECFVKEAPTGRRIDHPSYVPGMVRRVDCARAHRRSVRTAARRRGHRSPAAAALAGHTSLPSPCTIAGVHEAAGFEDVRLLSLSTAGPAQHATFVVERRPTTDLNDPVAVKANDVVGGRV